MPDPSDGRAWVRIAVDMPQHPKLAAVNDAAAAWAAVTGICYSARYRLDGVVPPAPVLREAGVGKSKGDKLVREGVWHRAGHECGECPQPPAGKVVIHDYLSWQESAEQIRSLSEARRAAGARGAEKRWNNRANGKSHSSGHSKSHPNSHGRPDGKPRSKPMADIDADVDTTTHPAQAAPETYDTGEKPPPGASGPTARQAYRLVQHVIGHGLPSTVLTDLAHRSAELLQQFDQDIVVEALSDWNSRSGVGPGLLPSLVADIVKRRNGATSRAGTRSGHDAARSVLDNHLRPDDDTRQLPPAGGAA